MFSLSRWGLLTCQIYCLALGAIAASAAVADLVASEAVASSPVDSAMRAVQAAPADAYQWAQLSLVAHQSGRPDLARKALTQSWALAPISRNLSLLRAQLGAPHWSTLTPEARVHLLRDVAEARYRAPEIYQTLLTRNPRLAVLRRMALRSTSFQKGSNR